MVNIKFCFKFNNLVETFECLTTVYDDETLMKRTVNDWFKRFKNG